MQGNATQDEGARFDLAVAGAAEPSRELISRHECPQRIGDIGVHARSSVQDRAPEYPLGVKVGNIETPQDAVCWQKEVEAHQETAGPGDTTDLADRLIEIG